MSFGRIGLVSLAVLALASPASAARPAPKGAPAPVAAGSASAAAEKGEVQEQEEDGDEAPPAPTLHPRTGSITLGDNLATMSIPPEFGYLSPDEADVVLVKVWGNPQDHEKTLGMLIPQNVEIDSDDSWGVVITYQGDGHVSDEDAEKIDYADLLKEMQDGVKEENAERKKGGYPEIELVGWASPPHYDKAAKKLYWAKDLRFGGKDHTLNYNIRVLGKEGVLVLNAVGGIPQLASIQKDMQTVLGFTEFNKGNRYEDFNAKTDKMAAYGIAALVAGGVAAKTGLFKGLIVALLAGKKLIVGLVAAVGAAFARVFKRNKSETA